MDIHRHTASRKFDETENPNISTKAKRPNFQEIPVNFYEVNTSQNW